MMRKKLLYIAFIMSLTKIPFAFLVGVGMHVTLSPPNPAAPKSQRIMGDVPVEMHLTTFIARHAYWVHTVIELVIIVAAAVPELTVVKPVLTILLPGRDPSRIFLSPMCVLATTLAMMGAGLRIQCYREMSKHLTFQVTISKNHKLITSGPYSYVRHPGYAGGFISIAGTVIWCTAQGSWLRESEVYKMPLAWLVLAPVIVILSLLLIAIFRRMHTEDEVLKKTFAKEWDEWARKVPARIFPGIY